MDTPRKTKLYNELAKDYQPKQAEMKICKYIEDMEEKFKERISELDKRIEAYNKRIDELNKCSEQIADNSIGYVNATPEETPEEINTTPETEEKKEIDGQAEPETARTPRRSRNNNT